MEFDKAILIHKFMSGWFIVKKYLSVISITVKTHVVNNYNILLAFSEEYKKRGQVLNLEVHQHVNYELVTVSEQQLQKKYVSKGKNVAILVLYGSIHTYSLKQKAVDYDLEYQMQH